MPRSPRNGFSSRGIGRYGSGLSPPDVERPDDERALGPERARDRAVYASACSSSVGAVARSRNRNSDRSSPTPSPPSSIACSRLGESADVGDDLDPVTVARHRRLRARGRDPPCARPCAAGGRGCARSRSADGLSCSAPCAPSRITGRAVGHLERARLDAGDGGDVERARQDGDVRRGAADVGAEAEHAATDRDSRCRRA